MSTAAAQAQIITEMTPERISEAIEWGRAVSERDLEQYVLETNPTWLVNFDTPFLRVAQLSASMKQHGLALKAAEIPAEILAAEVNLYALCRLQPDVDAPHVAGIDHVIIVKPGAVINVEGRSLLRQGTATIIQPRWSTPHVTRARARDDYGPPKIGMSIRAAFPLGAVAPGNEVHILFERGSKKIVRLDPELLAKVR